MIPHQNPWQGHYGAARQKRLTLHPFQGVAKIAQGGSLATPL